MIRPLLRWILGWVGFYINLFPTTRRLLNHIAPAVWRLPRGIRRRLCPENLVARVRGVKIYRYGCPERVRPPALLPGNLDHPLAMWPYSAKPWVAQIPAVWLVGQHATPVTSEGQILLSSFRDQVKFMTLEPQPDLFSWIEANGWKNQSDTPDYQHVCSFVNRLDSNYFHWITEWCSQVEGLQHYAEKVGAFPTVIIRAGGPRYQRESLNLLGIGDADILERPDGSQPAFVERYVSPSIPGVRVAASPRSLKWLRKQFLTAAEIENSRAKAHRRIYIARRAGGWRSVANDEEVRAGLEKEGFEVLSSENLSLREQIRLFSETRIIVGLHGAGLLNALFAPQASVLELRGDYGGGEYLSLTTAFEQTYRSLKCENYEKDDVLVDTRQLLQTVKSLIAD